MLRCGLADDVDHLGQFGDRSLAREEAVSEPPGTLGRRCGMAADDERHEYKPVDSPLDQCAGGTGETDRADDQQRRADRAVQTHAGDEHQRRHDQEATTDAKEPA